MLKEHSDIVPGRNTPKLMFYFSNLFGLAKKNKVVLTIIWILGKQ